MSENPYHSPRLDEVREKIDRLDQTIHDALMQRAELVLEIGEEKRKNNIQVVQPAREARMIRRLLSRHAGVLPQMAVVRIWRELVGAVSLLQTGLKVAVFTPEGKHDLWDLSRDYFGSCLPMTKFSSALHAVASVREDKATFAVLPWPQNEDEQPWWNYLSTGAPDEMHIIIRLPHGDDPEHPNPDQRALVISKSGFDDSGDDRSFLLIECSPQVSRARMVDVAKKLKLNPLSISSLRVTSGAPNKHLMEVEGYLGGKDTRGRAFQDALEDDGARVTCVGGYPVPATYTKTVKVQDDSKKTTAS